MTKQNTHFDRIYKLLYAEKVPKQGTVIREVYDQFMNNPLVPVTLSGKLYSIIPQLRWNYGLDIRNIGPKTYICFGTNTRDFLAESIKNEAIK